jgi:hypothetical protein
VIQFTIQTFFLGCDKRLAVKGRPRLEYRGRPNIQMVKPQTPVVFGGGERRPHVQSIDIVGGVNVLALNKGDSG